MYVVCIIDAICSCPPAAPEGTFTVSEGLPPGMCVFRMRAVARNGFAVSSETVPVPGKSTRHGLLMTLRGWLKRLVPRDWVREVRRFRQFNRSERAIYLKLRLANSLRSRDSLLVPRSARTIVFVCFGNIMRSPMSEHLFRRALAQLDPAANIYPELQITSAGLNAIEGRAAHPWAISAAREFGISLENHGATCLTQAMVDRADAILAMDYQNMVQLLSRYPAAKQKFFLLGAYLEHPPRPIEIRDPFFGNEQQTVDCYRLLQTCTKNLAVDLGSGHFIQEPSGAATEVGARS
jgi:protein-tyrosine phosphatase